VVGRNGGVPRVGVVCGTRGVGGRRGRQGGMVGGDDDDDCIIFEGTDVRNDRRTRDGIFPFWMRWDGVGLGCLEVF